MKNVMSMKEIFVTKSSMPPYEEYIEMIKPLWDSHRLTNMGEYHNRFEKQLKDYLQAEEVSLMTNGHLALELVIQAIGLPAGGEVITTPFTFISTTHAIVRNGLKPVFCDINADNYTMDVSKMEGLITENTVAIVPVHVYGQVCDVKAIEKLAHKYHLKVIYDAAHAFGVMYEGKSVLGYGDASVLSFHATKVFHTVEGGAVVYQDKKLGTELYRLKNFGIQNEILIDKAGSNAKLDELRAIMGLCNLKYIDAEIEKRGKVEERYRDNLKDIAGLHILKPQEDVRENYAYFPVVFDKNILGYGRDDVYCHLRKNQIYTRKYFYPLTCDAECYKGNFIDCQITTARKIADSVLTLPMYADLAVEEVDRICEYIRNMK